MKPALPKVAFVCLGNACRSQMAEGFARTYGADVMSPASAGLMPAIAVPVETRQAMMEKNIDISRHTPKGLESFPPGGFDLLINMSGFQVPGYPDARVWDVRDPYGSGLDTYRVVRDQIEMLVMNLILELRRRSIGSKRVTRTAPRPPCS
ncbi:MAG: low molecular weight phosphatase family protein [Bryobacteraceae bacterium]